MRRVMLFTVTVATVVATTALAASYQTGTYRQGAQSGFKAAGISIVIGKGTFRVNRILMRETCTSSGGATLHDFAGFQADSKSKLSGTIHASGSFSGSFSGDGSRVTISGHISGSDLTVKGAEKGTYTPPESTTHYSCTASGTFHPKRG